jgi:hypothetical protein
VVVSEAARIVLLLMIAVELPVLLYLSFRMYGLLETQDLGEHRDHRWVHCYPSRRIRHLTSR